MAAGRMSCARRRPSTPLSAVTLFRASDHETACPLLYQSGLGFILQGYKLGVVGGHEFRTGGDRYLILSNNLPIRCETLATSIEPVLGIHVAIDPLELQRLVSILNDDPAWKRQAAELDRDRRGCLQPTRMASRADRSILSLVSGA